MWTIKFLVGLIWFYCDVAWELQVKSHDIWNPNGTARLKWEYNIPSGFHQDSSRNNWTTAVPPYSAKTPARIPDFTRTTVGFRWSAGFWWEYQGEGWVQKCWQILPGIFYESARFWMVGLCSWSDNVGKLFQKWLSLNELERVDVMLWIQRGGLLLPLEY